MVAGIGRRGGARGPGRALPRLGRRVAHPAAGRRRHRQRLRLHRGTLAIRLPRARARSSSSSSSAWWPWPARRTCRRCSWEPLAFVAAVPVGALITAILVVNNLRDIDADRRAGKLTLGGSPRRSRRHDAGIRHPAGPRLSSRRSCSCSWAACLGGVSLAVLLPLATCRWRAAASRRPCGRRSASPQRRPQGDGPPVAGIRRALRGRARRAEALADAHRRRARGSAPDPLPGARETAAGTCAGSTACGHPARCAPTMDFEGRGEFAAPEPADIGAWTSRPAWWPRCWRPPGRPGGPRGRARDIDRWPFVGRAAARRQSNRRWWSCWRWCRPPIGGRVAGPRPRDGGAVNACSASATRPGRGSRRRAWWQTAGFRCLKLKAATRPRGDRASALAAVRAAVGLRRGAARRLQRQRSQ